MSSSFSIFTLPQVQNWIKNIQNDMDKYFWDEAICHFKIYDSFTPVMRFVVDLRIEGKMPQEIAKIMGKPINTVYDHLKKAKKRLKKVVLKVEKQ